MNKHIAAGDLAAPKVTTGPIAGSRKIHATPDAAPDLRVPLREIVLDASSGEPPVRVYDPSGPYTDDNVTINVDNGLSRARIEWVKARDGVEIEAAVSNLRLTGIAFDSTTLRVIAEAEGTAKVAVTELPRM